MDPGMHATPLEISDDSSNPVASESAIDGNPSNLIRSETVIEIRSDPAVPETVIEVRSEECGDSNVVENPDNMVEEVKVKVDLDDDDEDDDDCSSGESNGEDGLDGDKICRICHLSADRGPLTKDLIELGCLCRGELGAVHRNCAETWFKLKGNRCCEICGEIAKNISGVGDMRFMEEWNERRPVGNSSSIRSSRGRCWQGHRLCNFLMVCLVIAFILPWFFRVNMF